MKDSNLRSLVKGVSWRAFATIDTIVIAYLVTGEIRNAITIGAIELITKILLFYLHERVWVYYAQDKMYEKKWSIVKAFSWRLTGTADTMILSYLVITFGEGLMSGNGDAMKQASTIGMVELVTKMILFYFHERLWSNISFGRVPKKVA